MLSLIVRGLVIALFIIRAFFDSISCRRYCIILLLTIVFGRIGGLLLLTFSFSLISLIFLIE